MRTVLFLAAIGLAACSLYFDEHGSNNGVPPGSGSPDAGQQHPGDASTDDGGHPGDAGCADDAGGGFDAGFPEDAGWSPDDGGGFDADVTDAGGAPDAHW
jgi:hypothetical protein